MPLAAPAPRRRGVAPLAALAAALALAGCSPSFDLPGAAKLTCRTTADCPAGLVCQLDRCRDPAALDTTPPDLVGAVTVSPPRGKAGTAFTVRLTATEPLGAAPRVTLGLSTPVDLGGCAQEAGNAYACGYTASGDENGGAGGAAAVTVRLLDVAGNETVRGNVAALSLDFAPPAVSVASVSYLPAASNPLPFVARAAVGTKVRVAVSADEALSAGAAPTLAAPTAGSLAFALVAGSLTGTGAVFEATVPAGLADGSYPLTVSWQDAVGNAGSADLPASASVQVKSSAPVLVVDQAKLVFVRSPQGNAAAEPLGAYTLPAGPYFAVEPDASLSGEATLPAGALALAGGATPTRVVVQSSGGASPLVLGVLAPDAAGLFPRQQLVSPDLPAAWLVGVDDAGNRSAPVRLAQAEWVATSNRPIAGSRPHEVAWTRAAWAARTLPPDGLPATGTEDGGADRAAVLSRVALAWTERERSTGATPVGRAANGLAYDAARGRVVLFGGYSSGQDRSLGDTWEWDGDAWIDVSPRVGGPGEQDGFSMAYDAARGRTVLFGAGARTWEWDGAAWTDVTPLGPSPSARSLAQMVYDSARSRVVLFGGLAGGVYLADTWEWDGASWTNATPGSGNPPGRYDHAMAYDAARSRSVLFGGFGGASNLQDTWEWNGVAWQNVTPAGAKPSARSGAALAWDAGRGRTVLFGGLPASSRVQDTWEWNGAAWVDVTPAGAKPIARSDHRMVYDPLRGAVFLFAGNTSGSGDAADTQAWDGTAWSVLTPASPAPQWRTNHGMAWQPARRSVVVFGGWYFAPGAINGTRLSDTWEWDGTAWRDRTPATSPPARFGHALAHDSTRGRTVLFGGVTTVDTWEWDGAGWFDVTPAGTKPSARTAVAMAFESSRNRTILFGGSAAGVRQQDTWGWSGAAWTQLAVGGPPARSEHALAYDPVRDRVVLFGGTNAAGAALADTWEWNGATNAWTNVTPASGNPPARAGHTLAYDAARGRVLLVGGAGGGTTYVDVWEWSGSGWRDVTPPGAGPSARDGLRSAFDPLRGQLVVFGGGVTAAVPATVWELDARTTRAPAVQLDVRAAGAGFSAAAVSRLAVRAWAGGASGARVPGAQLLGWSTAATGAAAGWTALGANGVGLAAAAPYLPAPPASLVAWTSGSAEEARRYVTERDVRLGFQVQPLGPAGATADAATVALDFAELRVRYATAP